MEDQIVTEFTITQCDIDSLIEALDQWHEALCLNKMMEADIANSLETKLSIHESWYEAERDLKVRTNALKIKLSVLKKTII